MSIGEDFKGLPMESLIGSPLKAACAANLLLAQSTADFIMKVGFELKDNGEIEEENGKTKIRTADFAYDRTVINTDGKVTEPQRIDISVPLLAIVQIPSLKIVNVDISFDMEVKSHDSSTSKTNADAATSVSGSAGWGPFSVKVEVSGSVSTSKENTRSTDKSAKYHVEVKAEDTGMPEGLARVLDLMNQAVQPLILPEKNKN